LCIELLSALKFHREREPANLLQYIYIYNKSFYVRSHLNAGFAQGCNELIFS
jgi:hypothetical protein